MIIYPCGICQNSLDDDKESSILCDLYKFWIHPKYNNLNSIEFQHISGSSDPWFCLKSNRNLLPFGNLNNQDFQVLVSNNIINPLINGSSSVLLKPSSNLAFLFNHFNHLSIESNQSDPDNMISPNYYDINEIIKIKVDSSSLLLFHIITCSLNKNFDDLEYLLKTTNQDFDITAVSESRLKKDLNFTSNINLLNYVIKYADRS